MTGLGIITNMIAGAAIFAAADMFARKVFTRRFDEKLFTGKKSVLIQIIGALLSGLMMTLLGLYGYSPIRSLSLTVLAATALMISRIDRRKMIIPNEMVLALLGIRVLTLAGEITLDRVPVGTAVFDTFMGMIAATIIFLAARVFSKGSVGMGDIKLLAVVGMYVGIGTIIPLLMVTVFSSLVVGVILIARKTISRKDTMSFAPFIATGIVTVVLMGI